VTRWTPCKRRDFIRKLRSLGFDGPFFGTRHSFMVWGTHRLAIPSNVEYSVAQLHMLLRELESILGRPVSLEEWEKL
jgi:hypothetical protein